MVIFKRAPDDLYVRHATQGLTAPSVQLESTLPQDRCQQILLWRAHRALYVQLESIRATPVSLTVLCALPERLQTHCMLLVLCVALCVWPVSTVYRLKLRVPRALPGRSQIV